MPDAASLMNNRRSHRLHAADLLKPSRDVSGLDLLAGQCGLCIDPPEG